MRTGLCPTTMCLTPCVPSNVAHTLCPTMLSLQALHAAEESVKVDPTVAKSWCRLGDAYRACVPTPCVPTNVAHTLCPALLAFQALQAAEESAKADPTVAKSWCRLGDAYRACVPPQCVSLHVSHPLCPTCSYLSQALHAAESVKADPTVAKSWCRLGDAYRACVTPQCVSLHVSHSLCPTCSYLSWALHAAEESVKADPTAAKSWCRLGDAYRALDRWQLAHLAYTAVRELSSKDPDLQVGSRVCLCLCVLEKGGQWQLAHIAYTAARELSSKDPDLQVGSRVCLCLCVSGKRGGVSGSWHT
jgi:tetratricopeptide (TPR) repeat protein